MKIVIVGGGISGLSTYLFLRKHLPTTPTSLGGHEITIYESYPCPRPGQASGPAVKTTGAGIGVAPNGMRIIRSLDTAIYEDIVRQGYPASKAIMKAANGMTLGGMNSAAVVDGTVEGTVLSSRQGVWDCLRRYVPDHAIASGVKVKAAMCGPENGSGRPCIVTKDGQRIEADLVLGCDGVKSIVKHAVLGDSSKDEFPPHYEGLMGVGGFMPTSSLEPFTGGKAMGPTDGQLHLNLGAQGFFGYGPCTSLTDAPLTVTDLSTSMALSYGPIAMWWSSYESDSIPVDLRSFDKAAVIAQLVARHGDWQDPTISRIIHGLADLDFSLIPSWTTPKLPVWHKRGLVLIGDAAHALPSTSAQGVSMCFEDGFAFAWTLGEKLRIGHERAEEESEEKITGTAVEEAAKIFVQVRKPRVEMILDRARQMAGSKKRKSFVAEWITYGFIWFFCWMGIMDSWNKELYGYNLEVDLRKALGQS
ncbi:MAG: hypothetical protein M1814_000187 [Vezdaea aestivalis]|nr:MAG: hypothetical protein M1814_000187 [Vezdaea aestivalis]